MLERGPAVALIRHDKRPESPPHPRGGFLVGETLLPEVIQYFIRLGRIVAVYEPSDPLLNGYNLNLLFESASELVVEVLGPGFDASDLQRGDLSPHESWSVAVSSRKTILDMKLIHRTTEGSYKQSLQTRRQKIKRKLESSPTPELARKIQKELDIPDDLESYLDRIESPLLESEGYRPVAESVIENTIRTITGSDVLAVYRNETGVGFPLLTSTSFVDRGTRQVFWDIVSPALKFEGLPKAA